MEQPLPLVPGVLPTAVDERANIFCCEAANQMAEEQTAPALRCLSLRHPTHQRPEAQTRVAGLVGHQASGQPGPAALVLCAVPGVRCAWCYVLL
jgi:hypothetical protein